MEQKKINLPGRLDPCMLGPSGPPVEVPEYTQMIEGVRLLKTTGNEIGIRYMRDVVYAIMDGVSMHLQILKPATRNEPQKRYPCILFVQGSAWGPQYVYGQLPMMSSLAKRGYVVACVEYRHSGIAAFPAQAIDTCNAIRFMKANAEALGVDPDRMIVSGDSSGGHTALFAAILHNDDTSDNLFPNISAEIKGVINYYGSVTGMMEGVYPETPNPYTSDSPIGMLMGGIDVTERMDLRRKMSVECNVDENTPLAPVLMFHGTKDCVVRTSVGVMLYNHLKSMGKDVTFYLVEKASHGGPEYWTDEVLDIVEDFAQKCFRQKN